MKPASAGGLIRGSIHVALLALLLAALAACAPKAAVAPVDYSKYVWPRPPAQARLKLIKHIYTDLDIRQKTSAEVMFGEDVGFFFGKPHGVAVDNHDNIFVSDTQRNTVDIINLEKKTIETLFNPEGWSFPMHMAVDETNGLLAVAQLAKSDIMVFDIKTRKMTLSLGQGVLKKPIGVAFSPSNKRIYVSDSGRHAVFAFNYEGEYISELVPLGTAPGFVYFPSELEVDGEGNVYVVDTMNFRYQIFDPEGTLIRSVGEHGDSPGMFARPKGIAVSDDGKVFVTDAAFGNFQIFSKEGVVLLGVGVTGKDLGQFTIPQGIDVDHNDKVYIMDSINKRLQIFQYLSDRYLQQHPEEDINNSSTNEGQAAQETPKKDEKQDK